MEYVIGIIILLLRGLLWGVLADKIVHGKGYDENWFWWGFFFGLATVIFALLKPAIKPSSANSGWKMEQNRIRQILLDKKLLEDGGWVCSCGRVNANYVTTCPCGVNQRKHQ